MTGDIRGRSSIAGALEFHPHRQRHRAAARRVQAAHHDAMPAALRGNRLHAVLGLQRRGHAAQSRLTWTNLHVAPAEQILGLVAWVDNPIAGDERSGAEFSDPLLGWRRSVRNGIERRGAVWREGATPATHGHADDARALTPCPQAHQNQQLTEPPGGLTKDNPRAAFELNRRQLRSRCAGPIHYAAKPKQITLKLAGNSRPPMPAFGSKGYTLSSNDSDH